MKQRLEIIASLFYIFALSVSPLGANPGLKVRATAAVQAEDFSFTSNGMNGTALMELVLPELASVIFSQDTVRRFEKTETQSGLGGRWSWNPKMWSFLQFLYSPRFKTDTPKVLPQWSPEAGFGFLAFKKATFQGSYKFADYDTAKSHNFSLNSEWYAFPRFYLAARVSEVGTDFPASDRIWNTAYSLQPSLDILPERLTVLFIYAHSREPFESGAPGETRSFSADVYHGGAILRIKEWNVRAGWEYENRSNSTTVRRTNASVSRSW